MSKFKEWLDKRLKEDATSSADVAGVPQLLGRSIPEKRKKRRKKKVYKL